MATNIDPAREAELNRWAARFAGYVIDDGWTDPEEWEWIHAVDDNRLKGQFPFTRSLDAAREVVDKVWRMPGKEWQRFRQAALDQFSTHKGPASPFETFDCGFRLTPLQIILAAYHAVTGKPFDTKEATTDGE